MFNIFFLITLLPVLIHGVDYNLKECEGAPLPTELTIDECPNGAPCSFTPDETLHFNGKVLYDHVITSIKLFAEVIKANGEIIKLDEPFEDACLGLVDTKCPAQPGIHEFHSTIQLKGISAEDDVLLKIYSRDQDGKGISCTSMEIKF